MNIPTTLILALAVAVYWNRYAQIYAALILLLVMAYAVFDLIPWQRRGRDLARLTLVLLIVALLVIVPTWLEIQARRATAPFEHIHDGAIQTEEAIKFLLAGKNPYVEDYTQTPMAQWPAYDRPPSVNPALFYLPYLPATFLLPLPIVWLTHTALGFFDVRMYHLILFVALLLLLPLLGATWEHKLALITTIALQPLFVPFFIEGRNDIVVLGALVLTWVLLQRGHITASAMCLGVACAVKPTAWFAVPFFFVHLWHHAPTWKRLVRDAVLPGVGIAALFIMPFVIWDAHAFLTDALWYQSSGYQIWGQGLSQILLALGVIPHKDAPFPFVLIQIAVGVPALIWLLRWQSRAPTVKRMIAATSVWSFIVGYTGRALNDNHIGFILALGLLAWWIE